ncbi:subtilisin-like protein [Myriangium duriaei CBS 260.36]|uniref:Subtilisin-like protein n=1 Tax=Myriangium duriaei CBS 260.36 TaxID=1168546 RepID=A0A9P4MD98_9PEZI|nr:subtilisin-like protein [Myriangium duriaei CBS 260.36]
MILPVRIGLKQSNIDDGHELLMQVSHHESPDYGKYYNAEQVVDLFAPSSRTVDAVRAWLQGSGISPQRISQSMNRAWLQFDAPTDEVEELLHTKFYYFEHAESGDLSIACDEYHVPATVNDEVDYITPGVRLIKNGSGKKLAKLNKRGLGIKPAPPKSKPLPPGLSPSNGFSDQDPLAKCDQSVTPACVRALYNLTLGTKNAPGNQLGVYESGDAYIQGDLDAFFTKAFPSLPNGTHPELRSVDGGVAPVNETSGESDLDFQLAYPIVNPQGVVLFQVDDVPYTNTFERVGLFNTFLDSVDGSYCTYSYDGETGNDPVYDNTYPDPQEGGYKGQLQCGVYKPTNVISISYGANEADYSFAYQRRQCQEWMKLSLQGVTVVLASGDSGVGGRYGQGGHAQGCLGSNQSTFNPDYPATCPYITVVGSTYLPTGASVSKDQEVATSSFPSGGGFSNLYPQPEWQKSAVSSYLTINAPAEVRAYPYYEVFTKNETVGANGGLYNRDGRAYPDVSAVGDNIYVVTNGQESLSGGTSASAPIFASIINRINEERLAVGKSVVGFINPVMYAHPEVFNDITSGNNTACQSDGFIASTGWDPVTGLGTPSYPSMLKLFMSLP